MAEITDRGPNYGSNGYLTQEGRIADDMSHTRAALHAAHKALQDFDKRVVEAKRVVADGEANRPIYVDKFEKAQKAHQTALSHYTNNIWMDIQVKPKHVTPAEPIQ